MSRDDRRHKMNDGAGLADDLALLTPAQVRAIDQALGAVGPFGEVRIVKAKGRVRFIQELESRDLLKVGDDRGGP